jgi:hypothetical protein
MPNKRLARDMRLQVFAGASWHDVDHVALTRAIAHGTTTYTVSAYYTTDTRRPVDQFALEHAAATGLPIDIRFYFSGDDVVGLHQRADCAVFGPHVDYRPSDGAALAATVTYTLTIRCEIDERYNRDGWISTTLTTDPPQPEQPTA